MVSKWIEHVKSYAKKNNVSYKEAMSKAKASYKSGASTSTKKGNVRKGAKGVKGSRLAYDDTKDTKKK